jgi:hypothetical protein
LNGLINNDSWDEEDCVGESSSEVIDCVIYYLPGFVCRKLLQQISCDKCKSALTFEDVFSNHPEAELTNLKTFGFLTHPNINNKCSIQMLALTLFFKRQQHRKLSWLDKDQSQLDELFN